MEATITIPGRCNGPPDSANGGYSCGLVADLVGGAAEVTLRSPPPLERPLEVRAEGDRVQVFDGETLVAEGRPGDPGVEPPAPPDLALATSAAEAGRERWADGHPFPTCVTCGPDRAPGDGLRIFPGPLPGGEIFAAPWTPDPSLAGDDGAVEAPWVWAALDCPSSAPVNGGEGWSPVVLARLTARLERSVAAGEPHVIVAWPIGADGRKHHTGSALFDRGGALCGIARALWIELRNQP
ncbi:MAG TPA: hypothetical protein VK919_13595 [Solirubrobacterales bacterium]|nr:hypothetical protein [Solirubrobacterales bacterium]